MACNYCYKCRIPWPDDPKTYIGWNTRRDYTAKCVACLGPLEERQYQTAISQAKAISAAGWSEFVRRETRRERRRVAKGELSPETLGRLDAERQFKDQEAMRRDLATIKGLDETDPGVPRSRRKHERV